MNEIGMKKVRAAKKPKFKRDRRLALDEDERILKILEKCPDERVFFVLALESAMHMRECYTLEIDQVNLEKRTIDLDHTKNGNSRQVPLSGTATALLKEYFHNMANHIKERKGRIFPFWCSNRDQREFDITTRQLCRTFANIFSDARVVDLRLHDLRHEATCRLREKAKLPNVLIAKITGHPDLDRLRQHYAQPARK